MIFSAARWAAAASLAGSSFVFGRQSVDIGRLCTCVAWVLVAALSIALFGSGGGDDSHITWWVVDELVRTRHFHSFNGVALEQSSSLALVLIAALARWATGLPTPLLGVDISVAALSATCWMTSRVARRLSEDLALPATLLVATSGPLVYWGTSGMETALAAFSVAWLLDAIGYCLEQSDTTQSRRRALRCCFRVVPASALFVSVRPENPLIFAGMLVGGSILCGLSLEQGGLRRSVLPMPALLAASACALLLVLALFAFRQYVFHEWFPHPVSAKGAGGPRFSAGFGYLWRQILQFQPAIFLLLPVSTAVLLRALLPQRTKLISAFVVTLSVLGVVFICASGGDWMSCGRFLAPWMPAWWLTVLFALSLVCARSQLALGASVAALSLTNFWFLFGLARSGETNGYPLNAALAIIPAAKKQYALDSYSFIELANKSHLRDALLSEELKKVVARVAREIPGKLWLASGQAGAVPYHVFSAFPDRLHFIDFWGLPSSEVIPCIPRSRLRHSSLGVAASPELLFEFKDAILRDCHVKMADIVFNTSLRSGTRRGLEARGYRVVYFQHGAMPNYAQPGLLRGGTSMDAYMHISRSSVSSRTSSIWGTAKCTGRCPVPTDGSAGVTADVHGLHVTHAAAVMTS